MLKNGGEVFVTLNGDLGVLPVNMFLSHGNNFVIGGSSFKRALGPTKEPSAREERRLVKNSLLLGLLQRLARCLKSRFFGCENRYKSILVYKYRVIETGDFSEFFPR